MLEKNSYINYRPRNKSSHSASWKNRSKTSKKKKNSPDRVVKFRIEICGTHSCQTRFLRRFPRWYFIIKRKLPVYNEQHSRNLRKFCWNFRFLFLSDSNERKFDFGSKFPCVIRFILFAHSEQNGDIPFLYMYIYKKKELFKNNSQIFQPINHTNTRMQERVLSLVFNV